MAGLPPILERYRSFVVDRRSRIFSDDSLVALAFGVTEAIEAGRELREP
jgi:hypothetical protein